MDNEQLLKAAIRAELPAVAFVRRPWRALLMIPLVGMAMAGSLILILRPLPWYLALFGSMLLGNLYASMMFFGHEIGHGATVRSRRLQDLCLYCTCAIYCLSPHLWRVWHHQAHHPHANMPGVDPDAFDTLEAVSGWDQRTHFIVKMAPGSGHWSSALFLPSFFSLQTQRVLWNRSRVLPGFERLRRRRAVIDTAAMALFWLLLCIISGPRGTLFAVILPMLAANCVLMSYIATNHMLRPLVATRDTLSTTMSVTTGKLFDIIHFNFSHHVEHHLFPSMCSSYYPLVRQILRQHAADRYMAPPHWWALVVLFRTPHFYDDPRTLVEPFSGRRVAMADVEALLMEDGV
jgi:fatty acid desaturase